jgi:hypothetical protein
MAGTTDESMAGLSATERDLYAHLTSHVEAKGGLLDQYRTAAEESPSTALRYLVNLLIEDEIRHNRISKELASSIKADALMTGEDPIVPNIDFGGANQDAVIDLTNQLLEREQQDAIELKRLRRELRDSKDTTLWSLLVDLMERDIQTHIAILRFAKKHTRRTRD